MCLKVIKAYTNCYQYVIYKSLTNYNSSKSLFITFQLISSFHHFFSLCTAVCLHALKPLLLLHALVKSDSTASGISDYFGL